MSQGLRQQAPESRAVGVDKGEDLSWARGGEQIYAFVDPSHWRVAESILNGLETRRWRSEHVTGEKRG